MGALLRDLGHFDLDDLDGLGLRLAGEGLLVVFARLGVGGLGGLRVLDLVAVDVADALGVAAEDHGLGVDDARGRVGGVVLLRDLDRRHEGAEGLDGVEGAVLLEGLVGLDLGDRHVVPGLVIAGDARAEDLERAVVVLDEEAGVEHHRADGVARVVIRRERQEAVADVLHLPDDGGVLDHVVEVVEEDVAQDLRRELPVEKESEAFRQFGRGLADGVVGPLARGDRDRLQLVGESVDDDEAEEFEEALQNLTGDISVAVYVSDGNILFIIGASLNCEPTLIDEFCSEAGVDDPTNMPSSEAVTEALIDTLDDYAALFTARSEYNSGYSLYGF